MKRMTMKRDESGRMPFAVIAVLIILFAGFSTIYLASINSQYLYNSNKRVEDIKEIMAAEEEHINYLAEQAVLNVLNRDDSRSSLIWKLSQDAYRNFTELLSPYYPPNGLTTQSGYNIIIYNPAMTVSPAPFEYEDYNLLGMKARLRSHLYFKTIGSVELLVKDPKTNAQLNTSVALDNLVPSTRLFLMEQMVKLQTEMRGDTTVGSDIAEMVEYMLKHWAISNEELIGYNELVQAINVAILLEEIKLFHDYDDTTAKALESYYPKIDFIDYVANHAMVDPLDIFPGVDGDVKEILVDVSVLGQPFEFSGSNCDMADTKREIQVTHNWMGGPLSYIEWNYDDYYTEFELLKIDFEYLELDYYMRSYNIDVQSNPLSITLSSDDSLSEGHETSFTSEIMLDLNLRFLDDHTVESYEAKPVRILVSEYVNAIEEYTNYLKKSGDVTLEILNSDNVYLEDTEAFADIRLDGEFLGSFTESPTLPGIIEGIHELGVELFYPDGLKEFETLFFNITPQGILENAVNNILDFNVSFKGTDSTEFWEMMAFVQRDLSWEESLITGVEWISSIIGYPFPSEVKNISEFVERTAFEDYLGKFSGYIDSLPKIWDPSFSNFIDVAETTIEFAYDTFDMVEDIVNNGLPIGQIALNIAADYINITFKDNVSRTIAEIAFNLVGGIVQDLTFNIEDWFSKTKVLQNLKYMGDALALITTTISTFKWATDIVKIFTGEEELLLEDFISLTFNFAQIALKFWSMAINLIKNIINLAKDLVAKLTLRIQRISATVLIIYIFVSELEKNNWDFFKTIESLFLGFDELTISWYSTIVSTIVFEGLSYLFSGLISTYVGAIVFVVMVIIFIILNWDEICAWLTNSLSYNSVTALEKSITGSLHDTLNLTGKLNDMNPPSYAAQAKNYYSLSNDMLRRSYFVQDEVESRRFQNLSNYAYDLYEAYRDASVRAIQVKSSVKLFWFISNDFDYHYYPHGDNNAWACVKINSNCQTNGDLNKFLSSVSKGRAETEDVVYDIRNDFGTYGNPHNLAFDAWQSDLDSIGNFLSESIDKFQNAMGRLKFLNNYPDPCNYTRGYGALTIEVESQSDLTSLGIKVTFAGGQFRYGYNGKWAQGYSFTADMATDTNGNFTSLVLLVEPGTYYVNVYYSNFPVKTSNGILTIEESQVESYFVKARKRFKYTLNCTHNGYVEVELYKNNEAQPFNTQTFYSPGKRIITVPVDTMHYVIKVGWDTDGIIANGTEKNKSISWNSVYISIFQTLYFFDITIYVTIEAPETLRWGWF